MKNLFFCCTRSYSRQVTIVVQPWKHWITLKVCIIYFVSVTDNESQSLTLSLPAFVLDQYVLSMFTPNNPLARHILRTAASPLMMMKATPSFLAWFVCQALINPTSFALFLACSLASKPISFFIFWLELACSTLSRSKSLCMAMERSSSSFNSALSCSFSISSFCDWLLSTAIISSVAFSICGSVVPPSWAFCWACLISSLSWSNLASVCISFSCSSAIWYSIIFWVSCHSFTFRSVFSSCCARNLSCSCLRFSSTLMLLDPVLLLSLATSCGWGGWYAFFKPSFWKDLTSVDVYTHPLTSVDVYTHPPDFCWCVYTPLDFCWCVYTPPDFCWCVYTPPDFCWCVYTPPDFCWCVYTPLDFCWCVYTPPDFCWCLYTPPDFCWCLYTPPDFCWCVYTPPDFLLEKLIKAFPSFPSRRFLPFFPSLYQVAICVQSWKQNYEHSVTLSSHIWLSVIYCVMEEGMEILP